MIDNTYDVYLFDNDTKAVLIADAAGVIILDVKDPLHILPITSLKLPRGGQTFFEFSIKFTT
jgi:hypothetical protein